MQVLYGLSAVFAAVVDHTVALIQAQLGGQFGDDRKDMTYHSAVLVIELVGTGDMLPGHHQKVDRRLGRQIIKATQRSSSYSLLEGISPAAILQKIQSILLPPFRVG